jgi:hypothetical protein
MPQSMTWLSLLPPLGIEVVEAAAALLVDNAIANPLPVELGEDREAEPYRSGALRHLLALRRLLDLL